ncbi:MAG TPA: Ig-like domain-containing protein, partial [Myxococcaceae bacterium]|nr:Ig-like domain-containing protein [Myxococcaceae bacterium]
MTAATTELIAGHVSQLSIVVLDSRGQVSSGRPVTWSSTNAVIASVAQDGLVTGHTPGPVTIRATVDGVFGEVALTVSPVPVASVTINLDSTTLAPGDSVQLAAVARDPSGNALAGRNIVWSSSDTSTVTVTMAGVVKAVRAGRATITAVSEGKAGSARVVVVKRGTLADRLRIAAGVNFTCVLDATGAAWCWGGNANGQLGDGSRTNRLTAVAVTGGHTFRAISAGGTSVCGLKETGEVFCWGQLLGTSSTSSTPVRSSTLLLQELDVSDRHACGLSKEGIAY